MAAFGAVFAACREPIPASEKLALGTFVADLNGVAYPRHDTVRIAERVRGSACLLGNYVLLDSRDFSRRFLFHFPDVAAPAARHTLAFGALAKGHLNHMPLMRRGLTSLSVVVGHADIVAVSPEDIRGELRARLAEATLTGRGLRDVTVDTNTTRALVTLSASFRADTRRGDGCGVRP